MQTGPIRNNTPEIIIRDNENGKCMLLDAVISGHRNVIKKEAEMILKCKDLISGMLHIKIKHLTIEIHSVRSVKSKVTPVIIGATGIISKSFSKYLSNIPGKHDTKEVHQKATLGTAHILQ